MGTGYAFMLKYYLNKALKEKPSEVARVRAAYRSLNAEDLYRKLLDVYTRVWGSKLGGTSALERDIQSRLSGLIEKNGDYNLKEIK